ncbi:DUF4132 domain-containing protein [Nocardia huaxiensis]|uniref:DUF4132 domain-containing protein n=2 Tax=Nocardia huaxiensis TaxID=2755382 RepID=A0A7D6ZZ66_9NOCA|nr:DUF4132 domain-containing protein [Nocardia huaxiensis]
MMHAGAVLGDARFFDWISRMIETWNSCGNHLVAHAALEAYAANGSDPALAQLFRLSRAARSQKLAKRAQDAVTMAARWRGLTPEDLADLIVPSHGFALDGTRQLDYGPRGFVVTLDEQLKPIVFDAVRADSGRWSQGPRRRSLPKPGVKDDAVMAGAAHREFTVLRKEVKSTAAEQLTRFEAAMVRQRRWTAERFRSRIVDHPVLWQLARRLVWVACDADGKADSAFRIAEDRSLAAVDDRPFTLDDTATVGIAHPIQLGDTLPAWAELFADYQILQPFPQLERSVHRLSEAERPVEALTRFAGRTLATGRILGANKAGWLRQDIQSGAQWNLIFRPLGEGHTLVLDFEPGIRLFNELADPVQRIAQFRLAVTGSSAQWWGQGVPFGELDEITASEALLAFLALDPREP